MKTSRVNWSLLRVSVAMAACPVAAHAYMGPGAGLGAIGALLGLLGAVVLALIGLVWYPIKRLIRRRKAPPNPRPPSVDR